MFGYKKLHQEVSDLSKAIANLTLLLEEKEKAREKENGEINAKLHAQKTELSKINGRFHDLGEKFDTIHKYMEDVKNCSLKHLKIDDKLLDKLVTDQSLGIQISEFVQKQNMIFTYMKDLENLMGNVEKIVDQCLPEITLKLPKKKKAITEPS